MKSNNMEDLFREAAEKYEIDTEKAEAWNDVHDAVHADDAQLQKPPEDKKRRRWLIRGWLLLITLGWFAHYMYSNVNGTKNSDKKETFNNVTASQKTPIENNRPANDAASVRTPVVNNKAVANTQSRVTTTTNGELKGSLATDRNAGFSNLASSGNLQVKQSAGGVKRNDQQDPEQKDGAPAGNAVIKPQATGPVPNELAKNGLEKQDAPSTPATVAGGQKQEVAKSVNSPTSTKDASNATGSNSKKQTLPASPNHYFYLGLVASPDISFIHFQKTSTIGSGTGILLGYQLNKNLSAESGVLIDRKNYYTKGQYFDEKAMPYLVNNNISIVNANGDCNMFEIPVNLRYIFKTKGKNTWYASVGMSTYIMGREFYDYNYKYPWNPEVYNSAYVYHNGGNGWFSIVNLSAGYQRSIGSKTSIRIEPYIKLPAAGVGTGNLSIMSTGVYVGLTQRIP